MKIYEMGKESYGRWHYFFGRRICFHFSSIGVAIGWGRQVNAKYDPRHLIGAGFHLKKQPHYGRFWYVIV